MKSLHSELLYFFTYCLIFCYWKIFKCQNIIQKSSKFWNKKISTGKIGNMLHKICSYGGNTIVTWYVYCFKENCHTNDPPWQYKIENNNARIFLLSCTSNLTGLDIGASEYSNMGICIWKKKKNLYKLLDIIWLKLIYNNNCVPFNNYCRNHDWLPNPAIFLVQKEVTHITQSSPPLYIDDLVTLKFDVRHISSQPSNNGL